MPHNDSPQIKICGITNYPDAVMAIDAGADLLGFNFYPQSKRYISVTDAQVIVRRLPPIVKIVGIFVDATVQEVIETARKVPLDVLQFHGNEDPNFLSQCRDWTIIKAFRLRNETEIDQLDAFVDLADYFLFDTYSATAAGGTGEIIDDQLVTVLAQRGLLAKGYLSGGLTPENISEKVLKYLPYGVDVASGVERAPGRKDTAKVREFIANAKSPKI